MEKHSLNKYEQLTNMRRNNVFDVKNNGTYPIKQEYKDEFRNFFQSTSIYFNSNKI